MSDSFTSLFFSEDEEDDDDGRCATIGMVSNADRHIVMTVLFIIAAKILKI